MIILISLLLVACASISPPKECSPDQCYLTIKGITQDSFSTCVPTALAMVLNYYGDRITQDQIANHIQSTPRLTYFTKVKSFLEKRDYKFTLFMDDSGKSILNLKIQILSGTPIIIVGKPKSSSYYHAIVGAGFNKTRIFYLDPQKYGTQTMSYVEYNYFVKDPGSWILAIQKRRING